VRRSSTVPLPLGKTKVAESVGAFARLTRRIASVSGHSGIRRILPASRLVEMAFVDRFFYAKQSSLKIDMAPAQCHRLADPESGNY
jgi:hypothetical protein